MAISVMELFPAIASTTYQQNTRWNPRLKVSSGSKKARRDMTGAARLILVEQQDQCVPSWIFVMIITADVH